MPHAKVNYIMPKYDGGCLCNEITFTADGEPSDPHLCSCTMCQKSSGAPTVAWVEFPLKTFEWTGGARPTFYQSSQLIQRFFCSKCGSFMGCVDEGYENISITIASLKNPSLVVPSERHNYEESAPSWWKVSIIPRGGSGGVANNPTGI